MWFRFLLGGVLLDPRTQAFHETGAIPSRCAPLLWIAKATAIQAVLTKEQSRLIPPSEMQDTVNLVVKGSLILCSPALIVRNVRNLTATISGSEPELPKMDLEGSSGILIGDASLTFAKLRYVKHSAFCP